MKNKEAALHAMNDIVERYKADVYPVKKSLEEIQQSIISVLRTS